LWAILVSRIPAKIRPNTNPTMLPRQKSMERHVPGFSPVQCLPKKSGLKKFIFFATTTLTPAVPVPAADPAPRCYIIWHIRRVIPIAHFDSDKIGN